MSTRVTKKMFTPFEACQATGAVLLVNLYDPQIPPLRLFGEAVEQARLPLLIVGNKLDLVRPETVPKVWEELGQSFPTMSPLTGGQVVAEIENASRKDPVL